MLKTLPGSVFDGLASLQVLDLSENIRLTRKLHSKAPLFAELSNEVALKLH